MPVAITGQEFTVLIALLAAAAVTVAKPPAVSGDFDHDARLDRAEVVAASDGYRLIVRRAAAPDNPAIVTSLKAQELPGFFVEILEPGNYITACGKGAGRRSDPCQPTIDLKGPTLVFGTREASQLVAIWTGASFEIVALAD